MLDDVVSEDELSCRSTIGADDVSRLLDSVVLNCNVLCTAYLEEKRIIVRIHDVLEEIVGYLNSLCLLTGMFVVVPENVDARVCMSHNIIRNLNIFDCTPWSLSVLIAHRDDQSCDSNTPFDYIPIHDYVSGIL